MAAAAGVTLEHIAKSYIRKDVAKIVATRGSHPGLVDLISAMGACDGYQPWHDAPALPAPGQRRVPSLLLLLHGRRARPGLFAGVIVGISPFSALDDFSAAVRAPRSADADALPQRQDRQKRQLLQSRRTAPSARPSALAFNTPGIRRAHLLPALNTLFPSPSLAGSRACTPSASSSALGRAA